MQKEVADRLLAPAGHSDRGSLSVVLQRLFAVEKVTAAPAGAFLPPPKVESTVLKFVPRPNVEHDRGFESFVRAGFRQPRKT
ncbi:rRNA adenine N-6-methyltransferase family protein, partial [Acinetobacter baumannii]